MTGAENSAAGLGSVGTVQDAARIARRLLADVGTRLAHTRCVADHAAQATESLPADWREPLVSAAWLHDIGYAPSLVSSGFHPLDGARWLASQGWGPEVCSIVAWHTRAATECDLRGLLAETTAEFCLPPADVQAAMTWADLMSSPEGQPCSPEARVAGILDRYGRGSVVHEATCRNRADLLADIRSAEQAMVAIQGGVE